MNVKPDSPAPADPQAAEASTEDTVAAVKPVRRRRTVKAAEGADPAPASATETPATSDVSPAEVAVEAAVDEPVAAKPKRRRAAASAAADKPAEPVPPHVDTGLAASMEPRHIDAPAAAVGAPEAVRAPDGEEGASNTAASARPAAEGAASASSTNDPAPTAAADATASADATPADGSAPGGVDAADEARDNSPRSRRRGRRERRRNEAGALAENAPERRVAGQDAGNDGDADNDGDDAEGSGGAEIARAPAEPPVLAHEVFAQVLSGEFDVEEPEAAAAPAAPPKRVLAPDADAPKLHKVLAQAGIGSRRDMEELILDGQITVNGQPAHIGQRISFGDQIKVAGKPVKVRITPPPPRIIAYHKPVGEVVTHDDPQHRPTVFRRLPRLQQGKWQSVGRLDINTEGLLLFTNSGELANQLMHPRFGVEREYAVRVLGTLSEGDKAELLEGVDIDGQKASFRSIEDGGGEGANHWYRVVIAEGRNREVRKLFDTQDLTVSRLIRIRYGTVVLPRGLKRGVWVDLEDNDVREIRRLTLGDGPRRDAGQGGRGHDPRGQRNDRQNQNDRQGGRQNDRGRGPNPNANRGGRPNDFQPAPQAAEGPRDAGFERDLDHDIDFDPASIPNPLEQTFDKRFVQNPRSPAGGRGFGRGGGGFGAGGSAPAPAPRNSGGKGAPKQPDPLQTSMGYLGADAFHRKGGGGGGGGGGGNRGGGGGGGGFGGGRRGR